MLRIILIIALCAGIGYYFYDNLDNTTLRVAQVALDSENLAPNSIIMLNKIGLPPHVVDKLVKQQGAGTTLIVPVEDSDFTRKTFDELSAKYSGRPVVSIRLQIAVGPSYAKVDLTRLSGPSRSFQVNYDSKTDNWKVA